MEWSRGMIIGQGSSATVHTATSSHSTTVSAVKSAELLLPQSEQLQREQRILSSLSSPHIVSYRGCNITKEKNNTLFFNLFMEYMPFGNLSQQTRRHGGRLDEPAIAHYTEQVLKGLEYLHGKGVVHCDIKGSNILIGENGAKIGDFGCAKFVNESWVPIGGTPMFMAPEVARGEEQGYPGDVWALGCTVLEMATGFAPWPNVEDPVTVLYRVAYSEELPEIPSFLSDQAKDFLEKCFRRNPKERWSCSQLLNHPFLVEFSYNGKQIQESISSSPTSILQQGFWNSVEDTESESEVKCLVQKNFENSPAARIRRLALCSGDPTWTCDDEYWFTTRWTQTRASIGDWSDLDVVNSRLSGNFCEGYNYSRDISVVDNSLNFERDIAEMLLLSTLDIL